FGLICPTSPPPAFDYDQAIIDIRKVQGLKSSLLCLPHFKTIKPESSFFKKVSELYENWKRIITQFIASKTKLDEEATSDLRSLLESEYPVYGKVGKDMKLQIRRVNVPGLDQWILRRT